MSRKSVGPNGKRMKTSHNIRFDEVRYIDMLELMVLTAFNDRMKSMRYTTCHEFSMDSTMSQP